MSSAAALEWAVVLAYFAILTDITLQVRRVWARRSSGDVSIVGTAIRAAASFIFLAKYLAMGDPYMTIGQTFFLALIGVYLFLVVAFRISAIGNARRS